MMSSCRSICNFKLAGACWLLILSGCGDEGDVTRSRAANATPVTTARAVERRVEVTERSIGRLQAPTTPAIAAETAGRVTKINFDAGMAVDVGDIIAELDDAVQRSNVRAQSANVERLVVLRENQERTAARFEDLVVKDSAAQSLLDDAVAAHKALAAQLEEARARLADATRDLDRTRIRSPLPGIIQAKRVSVGDFVVGGQPLFDVVATDRLRAVAPFPETASSDLQIGQKVYIELVRSPSSRLESAISEIRPQIGLANRAVDVIVELAQTAGWRPGSSVAVSVVVEAREQSVTVPSESVVRRPVGNVVYLVASESVRQVPVDIGVRTVEWTEVLRGLQAGDIVVRDGAGFLTDGTAVEIREDIR